MKKTLLTGLATMMLISSISGVAFAQEVQENAPIIIETTSVEDDLVHVSPEDLYIPERDGIVEEAPLFNSDTNTISNQSFLRASFKATSVTIKTADKGSTVAVRTGFRKGSTVGYVTDGYTYTYLGSSRDAFTGELFYCVRTSNGKSGYIPAVYADLNYSWN